MSLISFRLYQEMADMREPAGRRGKNKGNFGDTPRIQTNQDKEDLEFLNQFQMKDWGRAQMARYEKFSKEIIPKLQSILDSKVKASGLEDAVFYYLKNGKQSSLHPLNDQVLKFIDEKFHVRAGRGLDVELGSPEQLSQIIEEIKQSLRHFEVVGKPHLVNQDLREKAHTIISQIEKLAKSGSENRIDPDVRGQLNRIHRELKRDDELEDITESILYDIFKRQTVDSLKFWKDNGLEKDLETFKLDGRGKEENAVKVKPYYFRLYHKLEKTRGEPHIDELKSILGDVGQYGYDLSNPAIEKSGVSTTGMTFGSKQTNANRWNSTMRNWLQHHSYGHFGSNEEADKLAWLDPESIVYTTVTAPGSSEPLEDPLYDWTYEKLWKEIKAEKRKARSNEEGSDEEVDDEEESDEEESEKGKAPSSQLEKEAKKEAEAILKNMVREGKLFARPVPCSEAQKDCPSKEDRKYRLEGDKVIKPPVYIAHRKDENGKLVPLVNPANYMKMISNIASAERYQRTLDTARDERGLDNLEDYVDPETGRVVRPPVWDAHVIDDPKTLNPGKSEFIGFGGFFNKNTKATKYISPRSREGKDIKDKYLKFNSEGYIEEFRAGILECLGISRKGSGCGGAPGFIINALKTGLGDVHAILYSWALADLRAMVPDPKKPDDIYLDEKSGKELSRKRMTWAATKTSLVAQGIANYGLGQDNFSRRLGVRTANVSSPQTKDGSSIDFGDKGFSSDDLGGKKLRGQPTGSGLNKPLRDKSIRELFAAAKAKNPGVLGSIKTAAAKADSGVRSIPSDQENPWSSLKKRVQQSGIERSKFEHELSRVLSGLGKTEDEINNLIANFKDETIESIISIMEESGTAPKIKKAAPKALPVPRAQVQPAGAPTGLSPLSKFRKKSTETPEEPVAGTGLSASSGVSLSNTSPLDQKVDWVTFRSLPINERASYLRSRLKG
jgi:hypothetical protein